MADLTPVRSQGQLDRGTVTYEDVRVVIRPEAPYHYHVEVSLEDGQRVSHEVEFVAVNATNISLESPIWFIHADLDVGVPLMHPGETAWVWP